MIKLHILRGISGEEWWLTVILGGESVKLGKFTFGCEFYWEFWAIKVVKRQKSEVL